MSAPNLFASGASSHASSFGRHLLLYTFDQCGADLSCSSFLYPPMPTTATPAVPFSPGLMRVVPYKAASSGWS
eukprot:31482-Pelagococcus_subviridis.AAC.14